MQATLQIWFSVTVSVSVLGAFVLLYAQEIRRAWNGQTQPSDPINDARAYVAVAVSGLVTTIIATSLSLTLPDPTTQGVPDSSGTARTTTAATSTEKSGAGSEAQSGPSAWVAEVGAGAASDEAGAGLKFWMGVAYVVAYTLVGFAAIVTWTNKPVSSLIKAQALTFLSAALVGTKEWLT